MDARKYNVEIAKGCFRRVYPVIAGQILARTGVKDGRVIDLGGGPGMLGISYAQISQANVTIYDLLPECIEVARENIVEAGLAGRMDAQQGRAEEMAFADNSVTLVMSRGSVYFWEDQKKGLGEIYRILKPGGWAYIGGGFGTAELLAEVMAEKKDAAEWNEKRKKRMQGNPPDRFKAMLVELGIPGEVESSPAGTWLVFQKT